MRTQEGDENVKIPPREQQRQRAHHSFMRRDEDLILSKKKSVELRSGKEKPEETQNVEVWVFVVAPGNR